MNSEKMSKEIMRMGARVFHVLWIFSFMKILVFVTVLAGCGGIIDDPVSGTGPPTVASTTPADSATDVALDSKISATFSKPMDPNTINESSFLVEEKASQQLITGGVSYSPSDMMATFSPVNPPGLSSNTTYRVTLTIEMTDLAGNPLKVDPPDFEFKWDFTTVP